MNLLNMKRWIVASAIREFKKYLEGQVMFSEGVDKFPDKLDSYFELRIDGPYFRPQPGGGGCIYIEINILAISKRSEQNAFKKENMQGIASQILNRDFCIYKIGNKDTNPADTGDLVGVMQLLPSDQIKNSDFGQDDEVVELYKSATEAHYEMYL